jgi:hypothetical protein
MLNCRTEKQRTNWMPLGCVREWKFCDYDGWAIERLADGETFFEHFRKGQRAPKVLEILDEPPELPAEKRPTRKKKRKR